MIKIKLTEIFLGFRRGLLDFSFDRSWGNRGRLDGGKRRIDSCEASQGQFQGLEKGMWEIGPHQVIPEEEPVPEPK